MKNKTLKKTIGFLLITAIVACGKDQITSNEDKVQIVNLSTDFNTKNLGIYGNEFGAMNDFTLRNKITRFRSQDGIKNSFNSFALTKEQNDLTKYQRVAFGNIEYLKENNIMEPSFLTTINTKNAGSYEDKTQEIANNNYGKIQSFITKSNSFSIEEEMYVPKVIEILGIENFDEKINGYWVNQSGFTIQYNQDAKNENGLALLIKWDGTTRNMTLEELGQADMSIKEAFAIFDPIDDGNFYVSNDALAKFPQYANLSIKLMRGNAKIIEKDHKNHYITTSSEQYEYLVLN